MRKKLYLLLALTAVVVLVGSVSYVVADRSNDQQNPSQSSPPTNTNPTPKPGDTAPQQSVTLHGNSICLEFREPQDVQIMMCASGFRTDDGKVYALTSEDPMLSSGIPGDQHYEITGTIIGSADNISQYKQEGTIRVTAARALEN